jgi:hypothetical protein
MTLTSGGVRKYRPLLTEDTRVIPKTCLASSSDFYIDNARVCTFSEITPVSEVSNVLYFLTLPLVSVMCVVYTSKGMSKKFGFALAIEKYSTLF